MLYLLLILGHQDIVLLLYSKIKDLSNSACHNDNVNSLKFVGNKQQPPEYVFDVPEGKHMLNMHLSLYVEAQPLKKEHNHLFYHVFINSLSCMSVWVEFCNGF